MPVVLVWLAVNSSSIRQIWRMNPLTFMLSKEGSEAKFWLDPVKIAREGKFRKSDLRDIQRIIEDNLEFLLNAWNEEKGKYVNG